MKRILSIIAFALISLLYLNFSYSQISAPTLSSPKDGSIQASEPVTVSWQSVNGATEYWIQVSDTQDDFSWPIYNNSTGSDTKKSLQGLSSGTKYYWHVKAGYYYDDGQGNLIEGWSDYSGTYSFTYKTPPSAPNLNSPGDNSSVYSNPTLIWTCTDESTDEYYFEVSVSNEINSEGYFKSTVTNGSFLDIMVNVGDQTQQQLTNLTVGNTYYWHVIAGNDQSDPEWGSFSATYSFIYSTPPPSITSFSPTQCAAGNNDLTSQLTIYGSNFGSAQGSVMFFCGNPNNSQYIYATSISAWTDYEITCMVPKGTSSGHVSVIRSDGASSSYQNLTITYGYEGGYWHNGPIQYSVDPANNSYTNTIADINLAANTWNKQPGLNISFQPNSQSTNMIYFGHPPSGKPAETTLKLDPNDPTNVIRCYTTLDETLIWNDNGYFLNQDLPSTMLHEFGHWLGNPSGFARFLFKRNSFTLTCIK